MDPTENARRELQAEVNANTGLRKDLEARYGQVWDTIEMQKDFDVQGFAAPFVVVVRQSDNKRGSLMFQHGPPRFYFNFQED